MATVETAMQFTIGCLTLGLGLFLIAGAIRDVHLGPLLPTVGARKITSFSARSVTEFGARTVAALGGALLLAAGGYAARLAVPL